MVDAWTTVVQTASLALAAWCGISAFRAQPMLVPHLIGIAVLEVLLLVQLVLSIVLLVEGPRPNDTVTFVSYLAALVLIPPACAMWGLMERSRWGTAVIAFACLILPVMMVRLEQIWNPPVV
ncbi:hypothetical protein NI17_022335 [Thermobifida halotolerans]|uniref:Uncharacterized protein n=1 Tax=Thermobifida halotolerans TaxID=483545 RepID=A0A399FYK5_9ACTN|nr:hypothetical protein [Thermobifida halotolerans]UOE19427.1 hypothetical protein NI17_022335 [Thermobifida halotolerans]